MRVHRTCDDLLRVDVYNTGPERRGSRPTEGHGGYGLIGLRERTVDLDVISLIRRGRADRPGVSFARHGHGGGGADDG